MKEIGQVKDVPLVSLCEVNKMAKDVLCEVNNCSYWADGNKCSADAIYVTSNKGKTAAKSEETDCKTFEPASGL